MSCLAFEAARVGIEVPPTLIATELEIRLLRIFGLTKRGFQRYLGLNANPAKVTKKQIYAVAGRASKRLARKKKWKNPLRRAFLEVAFGAVLQMLYRDETLLGNTRNVRELLAPFMQFDHPTRGTIGMSHDALMRLSTQIVFLLDGSRDVITFNLSKNRIFTALHAIPDDTLVRLFHIWPSVCKAYWVTFDKVSRLVGLPKMPAEAREVCNVMVLGILVSGHGMNMPTDIYESALAGDLRPFKRILDQFYRMLAVAVAAQNVIARFTKGK
jgi:hypothetical protein